MTEIVTGSPFSDDYLGHVRPRVDVSDDYDQPERLDVSAYGLRGAEGAYVYVDLDTKRHRYSFGLTFSSGQLIELLYDQAIELRKPGAATSIKKPFLIGPPPAKDECSGDECGVDA